MTFHLDLTDVAAHAASFPSLTGIQRVQIECARRLAESPDRRAAIIADLGGVHVDLAPLLADPRSVSAEAVFLAMRRLFGPARAIGLSRGSLSDARVNAAFRLRRAGARLGRAFGARPPRYGPPDCLYVGGAFWAYPPSVGTYERAARDGCDVVVLFHDVLPLVAPDLADSGCRPLFERMLRLPARAITVSRHAQGEIERARRALGASGDFAPATVTPLAHEFSAAPRNFVAAEPPTRRLAALDDGGAFVLSAGTIEARKNQGPLLHLWRSLAGEFGASWPRLVVAGRPGWRAKETIDMLKRADRAAPYLWVEGPTDAELAWLYSRARFTVFPSLAEGWGLPVGESLWFGKPCVASNATSIPEVGGDLCAYADPAAIDSFAPPIIRLVADADHYRASVAAIRASALRTWREAADALLEAAAPRRTETPARGQPLKAAADLTAL